MKIHVSYNLEFAGDAITDEVMCAIMPGTPGFIDCTVDGILITDMKDAHEAQR